MIREIESLIAAHPRRDEIHWTLGYVPEQDVPGLFLGADVLILPYRHIDQSGVLFQAFRFGLPVIAADVGSFRNYLNPNVGMIFEAGNPAALVAALNCYFTLRDQYGRLKIQTFAWQYEWKNVVRSLSAAYIDGSRKRTLKNL